MSGEQGYLDLVRCVLEDGELRRGRNGVTYGVFGKRLEFDLRAGFPLLTTKRVFWRGVVEELLWFLRGSTDATELRARDVHIWDGNSSRAFLDAAGLAEVPEGHIGAGYGYQWRCFGGDYPRRTDGVDQLRHVVSELVERPHGRRAVLSAWNPKQLDRMALPPCHVLYQFYRGRDGLSCQMAMRSSDVAAGLPFNIASTSLLTHVLARAVGDAPSRAIVVTGDTHLYESHVENAKVQLQRAPLAPPRVHVQKPGPAAGASVEDRVRWVESLTAADIALEDYRCHGPLAFPMVA
jgi:thymidylate synthase